MLIKKTNINKKKNVVPEKDFDFTNKKKTYNNLKINKTYAILP